MSSGLTFECKQRFALGINYAWQIFSGDFGGVPAWNQAGVTANAATVSAALADMKANGVSVIRWWMFPDFRGGGVTFDANGDATGLSATAKQDVATALKLAADNNLYVVLTIFSFDGFRPTRTDSGLKIPGMTPMVTDAARRAKLVDGVVGGAAKAVATSADAHRLLGWDVINEPEWAVKATGNAVGGQDFEPNSELDPVSLADMKALINESLTVLGRETPWALRSVGWAAAKWSWAFSDITNVEFNQPHIYEWVNKYWPYTKKPAELGYTNGKPTVMGEFYLQTNPFNTSDTYAQILQSWWTNGYAGAWGWQYVENKSSLPLTKAFATDKKCQAAF
jgi:hypothetical protein